MNGEREREIRYTKPKSTGKEKWNEGWMKIMQTNNENSPKTKTGLNNGGRELASRARQWLRWDSAKKTVTAKKREFVSGKGKSGGCSEGVRCWFASTFVFFLVFDFFFLSFSHLRRETGSLACQELDDEQQHYEREKDGQPNGHWILVVVAWRPWEIMSVDERSTDGAGAWSIYSVIGGAALEALVLWVGGRSGVANLARARVTNSVDVDDSSAKRVVRNNSAFHRIREVRVKQLRICQASARTSGSGIAANRWEWDTGSNGWRVQIWAAILS